MANGATFRICPETGLRVHSQAEALIKANAVVAVVFLAVGGLFGLYGGADPMAGGASAER